MFAKRIPVLVLVLLMLTAAIAFAHGAKEKTATAPSKSSTTSSTAMTSTSSSMYGGTLDLGGSAPTTITATFNPFAPTTDPGVYFVYEPLMYINPENGNTIPFLATSYKWTDNNLKLDVTLRKGVKWNDGTPFSAKDVVFTFNLLKKFPALDLQGLWAKISDMTSVTANGSDQVVFTFSQPNVPQAFYILRTVILPAHVWSKIGNPVKFQDSTNPVGTGPFMRTTYSVSNNVETLTKNPNYWKKGRPYINKIRIIGQVSNQAAFLQMRKGTTVENDIAIEAPKRTWVKLDPKHHLMFWPTYSTNNLVMNLAKAPFNNLAFRKALDLAINKHTLEERAYFGAGGYNVSQTDIIPGQRAKWYDQSLKSQDQALTTYNPKKALQILENAGYKKTSHGLVEPNGTPVPSMSILVGSGWTDFITMAQVISQELKNNLGITTTIKQETYSTYHTLLADGSFDMAISWPPIPGPNPYYAYDSQFYSQFSAPVGKTATSDWQRYTNPTIDKALQAFNSTSNAQAQKQAMYKIEKVMLNELPTIVLTERTGFDLYNSDHFTGWPSLQNPYSHGWNGTGLGMLPVVLRVHKS